MQQSNEDQNCSQNELRSGPPSRKTHGVPQLTMHLFFGSNNNGLSYTPYKQVIAVKSLNNFSNNKPHDPRGFKEEVKIKYNTVKEITRNFPNGTAVMMVLLAAAAPAIDWAGYCALTPDEQLV